MTSDFDAVFAERAHLIERVLKRNHGTHLVSDIYDGIASGQYQFWPGQKSVIVTEFIFYPRKKSLNIFLVAGNLKEILLMKPFVEDWAKQQGCDFVQATARGGWARVMKDVPTDGVFYMKGL